MKDTLLSIQVAVHAIRTASLLGDTQASCSRLPTDGHERLNLGEYAERAVLHGRCRWYDTHSLAALNRLQRCKGTRQPWQKMMRYKHGVCLLQRRHLRRHLTALDMSQAIYISIFVHWFIEAALYWQNQTASRETGSSCIQMSSASIYGRHRAKQSSRLLCPA